MRTLRKRHILQMIFWSVLEGFRSHPPRYACMQHALIHTCRAHKAIGRMIRALQRVPVPVPPQRRRGCRRHWCRRWCCRGNFNVQPGQDVCQNESRFANNKDKRKSRQPLRLNNRKQEQEAQLVHEAPRGVGKKARQTMVLPAKRC